MFIFQVIYQTMQIQTIICFILNMFSFISVYNQIHDCVKIFAFILIHGPASAHISIHYDNDYNDYIRRNEGREEREDDIVGSRHNFNRVIDETIYINLPLSAKEYWHIITYDYDKKQIALVIEILNSYGEIVLCLDVLMSAQTFFRFPIELAKKYLIETAEEDENEIILASDLGRITGETELYDVPNHTLIIKTIWIRIIQIKWKKKYAEKMRISRMRGSLLCQREFELTGKYTSYFSRVNKYKN